MEGTLGVQSNSCVSTFCCVLGTVAAMLWPYSAHYALAWILHPADVLDLFSQASASSHSPFLPRLLHLLWTGLLSFVFVLSLLFSPFARVDLQRARAAHSVFSRETS